MVLSYTARRRQEFSAEKLANYLVENMEGTEITFFCGNKKREELSTILSENNIVDNFRNKTNNLDGIIEKLSIMFQNMLIISLNRLLKMMFSKLNNLTDSKVVMETIFWTKSLPWTFRKSPRKDGNNSGKWLGNWRRNSFRSHF